MSLHKVKHAQCLGDGIGQEGQTHQSERGVTRFYQGVVSAEYPCQHIREEENEQAHHQHHRNQQAEDAPRENAETVEVFFAQQDTADVGDGGVRAG